MGNRTSAWRGVTLLACLSLTVVPGPRPPSALQDTSAARPRPLYARALAAGDRARQSRALGELQAFADELESKTWGLEEPLDTERVLASTIILCLLAASAEHASESLHEVLVDVEGHLGSDARDDPDLALALAHGWHALLLVKAGKELPPEERIAGLTFALESAHMIDAADYRDGLGVQLAEDLHAELALAGPPERATEALENGLARFPDDLGRRPFLLAIAADERRLQNSWSHAWADLRLGDEAVARIRALPESQAAALRRRLASVRCQLQIASGLVDLAVDSVEREREAVRDGADDEESRFSLLLDVSSVALVSPRSPVLARARNELESALAEGELFAARPDHRAQLRARLAVLQEMWEEVEPVSEPRAARLLEEALAQPGLEDVDRAMLILRLTGLAERSGDHAAASRWLAHLDPREAADAPRLLPEYAMSATAWGARVALSRRAERAELERHAAELSACYESYLSSWSDRPERAGGFGILLIPSRRQLLGTLVDLRLALDGEKGAESVIDLLLREQAHGSLAQALHAAPGSVAEARSLLLRNGAGMLLYLPSDLSTHLFCIDGERIDHFELPWRYGREESLRTLTELLASTPARLSDAERTRQQGDIESLSEELSSRLLPATVQRRLVTWKGAYVVGADLLGGIPFECLRVGGKELGTTVALAHLPSVPVGLALARQKPRDSRPELGLLLVAAPEGCPEPDAASEASTLRAFPFSAADAEALTMSFRPATVLEGANASYTGLLEALRRDEPRVLHFLVHGVNDPERELSGGLALSPCARHADGRLWCEDILGGDFRSPELVLLSACGSARGPRRLGDDGLAQLGGAFLARGTRCTVQATNDIALDPTVQTMAIFDRRLAAGDSPAEAMRAARAKLVAEKRFAHPFYAQSLRVVGLGLEPMIPRPGTR